MEEEGQHHKNPPRSKMAQITSEGPEKDPQPTSGEHGTGEAAAAGERGRAELDPEQEPGHNNERGAGMDATRSREAERRGSNPAAMPDADKVAEKAENNVREPGGELSEAGKSPVQGSLASGTDSAQEGSRVLKQEQREGDGVSSGASDRAKPAAKRRASVEVASSDGEPLSRMDSEDRCVHGGEPRAAVRCRPAARGLQAGNASSC